MQQKQTLLSLHFYKKSYLRFIIEISAKTVLCALGYIFNQVIRGKVQKPDAVGTWQMIIVNTSVCQYLDILLCTLGSS